jgi:hypothetical protein
MLLSSKKVNLGGGFKDYEKKKRNKKRQEANRYSVNTKSDESYGQEAYIPQYSQETFNP